ncbi:hypothetical protein BJY52DRAFT_1416707 [Lactarius psammicola]|nr:hypothetical protein BJY52DRAFT_1416707 [Lactarius psammicola]
MPRSHILPPLRARGGAPPSCAHPSVRVRPFSGLRPALPRPTSPARPPTFARMRGHGAGGATPGRSPLGLHRPSFRVAPLRAPPPPSCAHSIRAKGRVWEQAGGSRRCVGSCRSPCGGRRGCVRGGRSPFGGGRERVMRRTRRGGNARGGGMGGGGVDGKRTRKQGSRMMRGTVDEGAAHKPYFDAATYVLTLPPSCGRPAASSSRAPNPLRMGYDHRARIPDALRTGYDNSPHTSDSPSRKAVRRGTTRPPLPPSHRSCGMRHPRTPVNPPQPAPTHAPLRVCCGRRRAGGGARKGATRNEGRCNRAANGPGLHRQRRVLACAQRLEDARARWDGEGRGATQRKAARERRGVRTRVVLPRVRAKAGGCASGA